MSDSLLAGVQPAAEASGESAESAPAEQQTQQPQAEAVVGEVTAGEIVGKPEAKPEEGEATEFQLLEKFSSVEEQAKAYAELEKQFGGFTGAPESYEVNIPEGLVPEGSEIQIEVDQESEAFVELATLAKESKMSQELFDKVLGIALKRDYEAAKSDDQVKSEFAAQEMASLGDDGPVMLGKMKAWANNHIPAEHMEGFEDLVTSAAGANAMMHIIQTLTKNAPIPDNFGDLSPAPSITQADVDAERFKVDKNGNRLMSVDAAHREKVRKMTEQLVEQSG